MTRKTARTIDDIARIAGVSKSTVSRALNDSPLISRETKDRIRDIANEHSFHINAPARRLSLRQSRTIAFATYGHQEEFTVADQFVLEIMGGIARGLGEQGYDMLVVPASLQDPYWARSYIDSGRVDGFILIAGTRKAALINNLLAVGAPFIAWGIPAPGQSYCTVCGDNINGGRLATEHLIRTGRKRIAFLGGPEDEPEVRHRYLGYETALRQAGMEVRRDRIDFTDYCDTSMAAAKVEALLDRDPDIDAIFTNADLIAIIALETLRRRGRLVPDDVAVIGYDDLSLAAITTPPLTTVRQCMSTAGKHLAHDLVQFLRTGTVTNVTMPSSLVVRQSA